MGEMADFFLQQEMDAYGWSPVGSAKSPTRCKQCGSTAVRWRQQTGRWVLFSDKPGIEHVCANRAPTLDGFENEEEK